MISITISQGAEFRIPLKATDIEITAEDPDLMALVNRKIVERSIETEVNGI